jgi:hypothetical protein
LPHRPPFLALHTGDLYGSCSTECLPESADQHEVCVKAHALKSACPNAATRRCASSMASPPSDRPEPGRFSSTSPRRACPALEDAPQSVAAFRSSMAGYTWGRVPALAIAAFVRDSGAVYSSEILDRFLLSESTLRRWRPELARLGIRFLENGRSESSSTRRRERSGPGASRRASSF